MFRQVWDDWQKESYKWSVDYSLLYLTLFLAMLGGAMVASASIAISELRFDNPYHYFSRQLMALGLGIAAGLIAFKIPLSFWRKYRGGLFLIGLVLLVLVLGVGREINGSKRWLSLGFMNFQVSELMKMIVVLFMAGYLTRHASAVKEDMNAILRLAMPFGLMAILLLLEPDFGSTLVIAVIVTGMLLIAGAPWRFFVYTVVPVVILLVTMISTSEYRMARVASFFDPWSDPFGSGYQLTQALIASGRGEWFGVGVGQSVQKLLYLPDAHTDFLFSIYAEEMGLIGVAFLIMLYFLVFWRCFRIGRKAFDVNLGFQALIAYGIGVWIALQAVINMGVNLGLLPTKGLTLPFMSYGGSSLLVFSVAIALVLRADFEVRRRLLLPADYDPEEQTDEDLDVSDVKETQNG
jgi:cell division protein FtsW